MSEGGDFEGGHAHYSERPSWQESKQRQQVRWERRVVRSLLKFYGLQDCEAELRGACQQRTGRGRLLFCWFHAYYNTFPIWLVCRKVPHVHEMTPAEFWMHFTGTRLYRAFVKAGEDAPEDMPVGLVFEWLKTGRSSTKIVHSLVRAVTAPSLVHTFKPEGAETLQSVTVQELPGFLTNLGWQP